MMAEWKPVGLEKELNEGDMKQVVLGEEKILLAYVGGEYYAVQAFCSHLGGAFIQGRLDGHVVSCPRNKSKFDVRDGSVVIWLSRFPELVRKAAGAVMPPRCLRTFPTRVKSGQVWVQA
jgi:3-phenylpropionate/trans-cinnamate dioxygenase ferredoxin component